MTLTMRPADTEQVTFVMKHFYNKIQNNKNKTFLAQFKGLVHPKCENSVIRQ